MGYDTRNNGQIRIYYPDDTDNEIYLAESSDLTDIMKAAVKKWPGINMVEIRISAEHIHTDCLGYDRYDGMDYTNFIVVSKI